MLYSYNGGKPAPLPKRFRTPEGSVRTSLDECSPEELDAWGFVPAEPAPDAPAGKVAEWSGADWILRDKTEAELLAETPWHTYEDAIRAVVRWIDGLTAQVMDEYPRAVVERWATEEAAARAVLDPNVTPTEYQLRIITEEGAAKGRTPAEHAQIIVLKADKFRAIADQINKLFLSTDRALQEASSPLEYPAIFEAAKAQAVPLARAYGLKA